MKHSDENHGFGTGKVSVDTIWLSIEGSAYQTSESPDLKVKREPGKRACVLWRNADGTEVWGTKAHGGANDVYVELNPVCGRRYSVPPFCFIQFSAPKHYYGHNGWAIDKDQLRGVFNGVQDELNCIGIETDILAAKVSRVDFFRDIFLQREVRDYIPVFRSVNFPNFSSSNEFYPTSTHHSNKSRQVAFYDKFADLLEKHPKLRRLIPPDKHMFRSEYRLFKSRSVRTYLNRLREAPENHSVLAGDVVEEYDVFCGYHLHETERIFRAFYDAKSNQSDFYPSNLIEAGSQNLPLYELRKMQVSDLGRAYGRGSYRRLTSLYGLEAKLGQRAWNDNREADLVVLLRKKASPKSISSMRSRLRAEMQKLMRFAILPCGVPFISLLEEVAAKLSTPPMQILESQQHRPALPVPGETDVLAEIVPASDDMPEVERKHA